MEPIQSRVNIFLLQRLYLLHTIELKIQYSLRLVTVAFFFHFCASYLAASPYNRGYISVAAGHTWWMLHNICVASSY